MRPVIDTRPCQGDCYVPGERYVKPGAIPTCADCAEYCWEGVWRENAPENVDEACYGKCLGVLGLEYIGKFDMERGRRGDRS